MPLITTVGSVCSGIEAASVAWGPLGVHFDWFSEIAPFPSRVLAEKYPAVPNLGDMRDLPAKIAQGEVTAPDLICGGTPCQAFSLAGWQNGLNDDRGNLTLRFVDIIEANDAARLSKGQGRCKVFWENVEGVLTDKTNAFGCLVSSLAGLNKILYAEGGRWPSAGLVRGKKRNVAWRVLDAKFFGLPQQRRRLYLVAGGRDFHPEDVLFEIHENDLPEYPQFPLTFEKEGHHFEVFRAYTDCLYSAYGTKWNGNAAAYNGSLFVVQDHRIRRLSPLETKRLMGLPDHYTALPKAKKTYRYQSTGNSWAVPVVRWIGERLMGGHRLGIRLDSFQSALSGHFVRIAGAQAYYDLGRDIVPLGNGISLNCSAVPEHCTFAGMDRIVSPDAPKDIYISPVGCFGIIRRKNERNLKINARLEEVLLSIASEMSPEEIERKSRVQRRGRFSTPDEAGGARESEGPGCVGRAAGQPARATAGGSARPPSSQGAGSSQIQPAESPERPVLALA